MFECRKKISARQSLALIVKVGNFTTERGPEVELRVPRLPHQSPRSSPPQPASGAHCSDHKTLNRSPGPCLSATTGGRRRFNIYSLNCTEALISETMTGFEADSQSI